LRQRRLVQPVFHPGRMAHYAQGMVEQTRRMLARWHDGMELNAADAMTHLTLDTVGTILFGMDLPGQEAGNRKIIMPP
jgi:pentalenene oxygenase